MTQHAQPAPRGKGSSQVQGQEPEEELEEPLAAGVPTWMEAALPWMVSVIFHMGLFLVFAFAVFVYGQHTKADDREQIIIPSAGTDDSLLAHVEHPGLNGDPTRDAAQNLKKDVTTAGWAQVESKENVATLLEGSAGDNVADLIALGTGGSVGKGTGGTGRGAGGVLAPYGTPGGGAGGIGVKFFDTNAKAKKIVYILDHSGSMLDTFDDLKNEAIKSVNSMIPVQSFSVVMFSETAEPIFMSLQRATTDAKKDFATKLSAFRAQGMNDDLLVPFQDAFEKAFSMHPEVIYFLTDGHFDPQLEKIVDNLNHDRKVKINTLAFIIHDASYEDQLKEMAKKNGGQYKFVSLKDLGR